MPDVLNAFQVRQFIDSGNPHTSKTYETMLTLIDQKNIPFKVAERGQTINLDPALSINILNPGSTLTGDLNEDSVVLKLRYGQNTFLFMGDAGISTEQKLISANYDLRSEILKVGHHGSRYSSGASFLAAVDPQVSIIMVGEGNTYGHPTPEIISALHKIGSTIYRTDYNGNIIVTSDGTSYTIRTQTSGTSPASTATWTAVTTTPSTTTPTTATGGLTSSVIVSDLNLKDEWVMIKNTGSSPVSLLGWKITDEGTKHAYTFSSFTLTAGSTVTVYTEKGTDTPTKLYWGSGSPIWNNDGDIASLFDASGTLIHTLRK
jgi:hypothetical protein